MSAASLRRSPRIEQVRLGGGYLVTFSLDRGCLDCAWEPCAPRGRGSGAILAASAAARAAFLLRHADQVRGAARETAA